MDRSEFTKELKDLLREKGAELVGTGDMRGVAGGAYPVGISIAIPLPKRLILDLHTAPTKEYNEVYHSLNQKLNSIVLSGEEFLTERGYNAFAQTTDRVSVDERHRSALPHKTVATRAGIGWIGKNNLIVTREFGSAVRLSSLLTDAPLECGVPYNESLCGKCDLCVRQCPARALKGTLWRVGMPREELVDVDVCYKKQCEIMYANTGIDTDLCGKCFAVCAYTERYLRSGV